MNNSFMNFLMLKYYKHQAFLLLLVSILCFPCYGQQRIKSLSDKDKAEIIKSILVEADLLNRTLGMGEEKEIVPLSLKNISPEVVPKLKGITFDLLTTQEIQAKTQTGFLYYCFEKFEIKGSKVEVEFGETNLYSKGEETHSNSQKYEFRKVRSKWIGKRIGFSISRS